MTHQIYCSKLNEWLEPLEAPPFPGSLGEKIFKQISKKAWNGWLAHQTMLINEYRLSLIDTNARQFLQQEMNKYFFESETNN